VQGGHVLKLGFKGDAVQARAAALQIFSIQTPLLRRHEQSRLSRIPYHFPLAVVLGLEAGVVAEAAGHQASL
jgi:hypothetical protein